MRILTMALLLNAISVCPATLAAQKYGPAPDAATRKEVMAVREAAWRTWFSNDTAGFDRVVAYLDYEARETHARAVSADEAIKLLSAAERDLARLPADMDGTALLAAGHRMRRVGVRIGDDRR